MSNQTFNTFNTPPEFKAIMKNIKVIIIVILAIILVWGSVFQVETEEVGVITRFGKFSRITDPGLNSKIPFIERVYKVPTERQQKLEFGFRTVRAGVQTEYSTTGQGDESLMLTGDLNLADVEWVVQYRIDDPYNYLFKVRNPEGTLRDLSEATVRQIVGDRTVNEVLTVGRIEITVKVEEMLQALCRDYSLGISNS